MKLLGAVNGGLATDYKEFARKVKPFVIGGKGYCKINLYLLAFKDTSPTLWHERFWKATGLNSKAEYVSWIRLHRFPVIKSWVERFSPRLIVCTGKSYLSDFKAAFVDNDLSIHSEVIDDRELHWALNMCGTLVAVVPFMVNRNGLIKNDSIQKFGDRIRSLLDGQP